jgi:hypothetical protein
MAKHVRGICAAIEHVPEADLEPCAPCIEIFCAHLAPILVTTTQPCMSPLAHLLRRKQKRGLREWHAEKHGDHFQREKMKKG